MGTLASLLISIVVVVAIGMAATWYLQRVRLPREETAEGIAALADMRWREFMHLILDVLAGRGYARVNDPAAASDEADIPLQRDGESWLLSSKHGASYVLGTDAISELASAMRMRGAQGGLLATPGTFAPEARRLAQPQHIELLDGPGLWPELRQRMSQEQRDAIGSQARTRARQHAWFGWLAGVVLGAALVLLVHDDAGPAAPAQATAAVSAPTAQAPALRQGARPATAANGAKPAPRDADPATLENERKEAARAIGALPMVERAMWSSQSTLVVYLSNTSQDARAAICPLLEHYPELGASRVQLQPPNGNGDQVRFFQCRAY